MNDHPSPSPGDASPGPLPPDDGRRDLSISMQQANAYGLLFLIPAGALLALPYAALWGFDAFGAAWSTSLDNLFVALGAFIAGIVVHELIHGITWRIAGKKTAEAVRYGIQWKTLTPYAHCTEPMAARAYRLGAAMPGLLLGLVPWLIALATGNGPLMVFGMVFTLAAAGDAMILWLLRSVPPHAQVIDHPTRAGCYVLPD